MLKTFGTALVTAVLVSAFWIFWYNIRSAPVVTLAGLQAGQLVGGAVLTETVFAWPGIGRLMFEALAQRDYNLLLGVFFVSAAMVLLFNLITDILYRVVDPRIRVA